MDTRRACSTPQWVEPLPMQLLLRIHQIFELSGNEPISIDNFLLEYKCIYAEEFPESISNFNCPIRRLLQAHSTYFHMRRDGITEEHKIWWNKSAALPENDLQVIVHQDASVQGHRGTVTGFGMPKAAPVPVFNDGDLISFDDPVCSPLPTQYPPVVAKVQSKQSVACTEWEQVTQELNNELKENPPPPERKRIGVRGEVCKRRVRLVDELETPPTLSPKSLQSMMGFIAEFETIKNSKRTILEEIWTYFYDILKEFAPAESSFLRCEVLNHLFYDRFNIPWNNYITSVCTTGEFIKSECFLQSFQEYVEYRHNPICEMEFRLRSCPLAFDRIRSLAFSDKKLVMTKTSKKKIPLVIFTPGEIKGEDLDVDELEDLLCQSLINILPQPTPRDNLISCSEPVLFDQFYSSQIYAVLVEHFPVGIDSKGLARGIKLKYGAGLVSSSGIEKYCTLHMQHLVTITQPSRVHTWISPRYDVHFVDGHHFPLYILEKTGMVEKFREEQSKFRDPEDLLSRTDDKVAGGQVYDPHSDRGQQKLGRRPVDQCTGVVLDNLLPLFPGGIETSGLFLLLNRYWDIGRNEVLPDLASPLNYQQLAHLLECDWRGGVDRRVFPTGAWIRNKEFASQDWCKATQGVSVGFSPFMFLPEDKGDTVEDELNPNNQTPSNHNITETETEIPRLTETETEIDSCDDTLRDQHAMLWLLFDVLIDKAMQANASNQFTFTQMNRVFPNVSSDFVKEHSNMLSLEEWSRLEFEHIEEDLMQYIIESPMTFTMKMDANGDYLIKVAKKN